MISKFTKILPAILLSILGFSILITVPNVMAEDDTPPSKTNSTSSIDDICSRLNKNSAAWEANGCGGSSDQLDDVIINIVNVVIGIVGIIAVIYIIIGGIHYMTSAGDATKIQKAKNTILYAVIGLIVCILAAAIVNFVIKAATGTPDTPETPTPAPTAT